ncbi:MAG: yviE [Pelosinus sp.]|jgi:hypothetical protein|nr:yviE [Pelosinus sp.]
MLVINIATQPMKIELTPQHASLDLQTTKSQVQINSQSARVEISQPKGQLEIDQTQFRYAYGKKDMKDFIRDFAQEGRQAAMQAIASIAANGDRLANISSRENTIAAMSAESTIKPVGELTWVSVPPADIKYTPHYPVTNVADGNLNLSWQMGTVQGTYQPSKMNLDVVQYPTIKMWTTQNKVDTMA